jgi:hypothetical protein
VRVARNWFAGLALGASAGVLLGVMPTFGVVILTAFLIPAAGSEHGRAAASGLLVGMAATWLGLVLAAEARCAAFDAGPNQGCVAPDLTGWVVLAGGLLVAGGVGSLVLFSRRRRA